MRNLSILFIVMVMGFVVAPSNILAGGEKKVPPLYSIAINNQFMMGYCVNTDEEVQIVQSKTAPYTDYLVQENELFEPLQTLAEALENDFSYMHCREFMRISIYYRINYGTDDAYTYLFKANINDSYSNVTEGYSVDGYCEHDTNIHAALFEGEDKKAVLDVREVPAYYRRFVHEAKKYALPCNGNGTYSVKYKKLL